MIPEQERPKLREAAAAIAEDIAWLRLHTERPWPRLKIPLPDGRVLECMITQPVQLQMRHSFDFETLEGALELISSALKTAVLRNAFSGPATISISSDGGLSLTMHDFRRMSSYGPEDVAGELMRMMPKGAN